MPGMGGPNASRNFLLNCHGWNKLRRENPCILDKTESPKNIDIRLAPITGAVENIGYFDEKQFYFDLIESCTKAGLSLSIGDGCPDYKLQYGIDAVIEVQKTFSQKKSAVIIKPYPNEKMFERYEWASKVIEIGGIDIDSYNIVTMRDLVHLEKKTSAQLIEIKNFLSHKGIPFAIKGVFTKEDVEIVKEVHPDIVYISNHGGRVDTREGSTAEFLEENHKTFLSNCENLWVDGGIRSYNDVQTAAYFGVTTVLLGRPIITSLCESKNKSVNHDLEKFKKNPKTDS